jgi:hypothetical protein
MIPPFKNTLVPQYGRYSHLWKNAEGRESESDMQHVNACALCATQPKATLNARKYILEAVKRIRGIPSDWFLCPSELDKLCAGLQWDGVRSCGDLLALTKTPNCFCASPDLLTENYGRNE